MDKLSELMILRYSTRLKLCEPRRSFGKVRAAFDEIIIPKTTKKNTMNPKTNQYILILGGEYMLRERVLAGALRASGGMPIIKITKSSASPTIRSYDDYIVGDHCNPDDVLAAVKRYEQEHQCTPAAVVPIGDFDLTSAVAVAAHYGLNHNSADTINKCRNKLLMKQTLAAAGLPLPRYGAFSNLQELKKIVDEIGLPVVIKPGELAGSVGVLKVSTPEELEPAFNQCITDIKSLHGMFGTAENYFLVEEYIPSRHEVSVEVINHGDLHRAIAITDKYLGEEPYFVETGHSIPSIYTEHYNLKALAEKACAALGIRFGMAHFEARITPAGEVRLIEVAARQGGDAIMELVERSYGINPYQLHVASYLGIPPPLPEQLVSRGLSAVSFLKAPEGVIEKVILPTVIPQSIINLQVTGKPMDSSKKLTSSLLREGSLEFFWKGRQPEPGFDEHLRVAAQLSSEIFTMRREN